MTLTWTWTWESIPPPLSYSLTLLSHSSLTCSLRCMRERMERWTLRPPAQRVVRAIGEAGEGIHSVIDMRHTPCAISYAYLDLRHLSSYRLPYTESWVTPSFPRTRVTGSFARPGDKGPRFQGSHHLLPGPTKLRNPVSNRSTHICTPGTFVHLSLLREGHHHRSLSLQHAGPHTNSD